MIRIPTSVTRAVGKAVLQSKKNSPHIFFAAGVIGAVGSTVLACRATLKLEATLDEIKADVEKVKVAENLTTEEHYRLLGVKYARGAVKLGRLYGPSIIIGGVSVACLTGSHVQMNRRNQALSATLALVTQAFDEYRTRVREEFGDEKELDIINGIEEKEATIDGKKQLVKVVGRGSLSPYARCFDDQTSIHWDKYPEITKNFIEGQQQYANQRLNVYGYVFLNEVYEALGMEKTTAGSVVGWVKHSDNGDGYIDFGLYTNPANVEFLLKSDWKAWLDFNVDGEIYQLIDEINAGKR